MDVGFVLIQEFLNYSTFIDLATMFRYFRKRLDKHVNAYCDACYETGKHKVEFTKNYVTLDCVGCNNQRFYQRFRLAPINFASWGQKTQNDDRTGPGGQPVLISS
jgi:hypothetical protein